MPSRLSSRSRSLSLLWLLLLLLLLLDLSPVILLGSLSSIISTTMALQSTWMSMSTTPSRIFATVSGSVAAEKRRAAGGGGLRMTSSFLTVRTVSALTSVVPTTHTSNRSRRLAADRYQNSQSLFLSSAVGRRRSSPSSFLLSSSSPSPSDIDNGNGNGDSSNNASNDSPTNEDFQPTWTYVPYDPKRPRNNNSNNNASSNNTRRRYFSSWTVPQSITIPEDQIEINFVRSSGAGGQNVNKVNTKVEIRLHVMDSSWIGPEEVRRRLVEQQSGRINKNGVLTITSQEYRTQAQNRKSALTKLSQMILDAWPRPKIRKQRTGISKASKERNKEYKRRRSETKQNRKRIDW